MSAGTSGACSVEEDALARTMVSGMSETARAEMWAAQSQDLPAADAGSTDPQGLPVADTAYLQATFDEPEATTQATTFYPAGSWVATRAAPGMDSTLLPDVDEDAHDGLDLKFDVEYQKVDHSVFKQQLYDGLLDIGVQKKSLAVVDVALREGSVIAELRGPHFAVEDIRGKDLRKLEVMGKPPQVNPYPPLALPSLMEVADGQRSEAVYSTTSSALQEDFMRSTATRLADSASLQETLDPEASRTADPTALLESLRPGDDAGAERSEVGFSAASSAVEDDMLRSTASRLADAARAQESARPDSGGSSEEEVLSTRGAGNVAIDMAADLAAAAGIEEAELDASRRSDVSVGTTEAENDASRRAAQRALDKAAKMAQEVSQQDAAGTQPPPPPLAPGHSASSDAEVYMPSPGSPPSRTRWARRSPPTSSTA